MGAIQVHPSDSERLAHRMVKGFEYCGLDTMNSFMPRLLRRLCKQQRWGFLTHGLTPPLAMLGSDYPPLLCTLPVLKMKRTES